MTLKQRAKRVASPYIVQFGRSPKWVQVTVVVLITLILLPDPFDWIPGIQFADEVLYATILLKLLYKYGALPNEKKKTAKDLIKDIFEKDESR